MNKLQIERLQTLEKLVNRRDPFQKTLLDFIKEINNINNVRTSITDYNAVGDNRTDNVNAIKTACINSTGFYVPAGVYLIKTNLSITVPIQLLPGAVFNISAGATLTITKGFECGLHQCFIGDGDVIFEGGSVDEAPIQWFGAVSNNSTSVFDNDISQAFNKALNCNATVKVPAGYYYLAETVEITKPINIKFNKGKYPHDRYPPPVDTLRDVERNNRSVIYTNLDIDFFVIKSRSVWIDGGTYDATNVIVNTNTSAVFHYLPEALNVSTTPATETNIESYGMRQGGITDFLICGNGRVLKDAGNGIIGIYLDWLNADSQSYMYRHIWSGYFENVKCGLFETTDGGRGASNSCWHIINFNVWVAKQAIVINRSTENNIDLMFQSAPVLDVSEKDLAVVVFKGVYGNSVKCRFVDMMARQFSDSSSIYHLGWFHTYSVEDYTGKNFIVRTNTDVDIAERSRKRVAGATNGLTNTYADAMSGILPSGQYSNIYEGFRSALYSNALVAADKRFHLAVGYYEKPTGVDFIDIEEPSRDYGCTVTTNVVGQRVENLWYPYVGFTEFFWLEDANETDYVEITIEGIEREFIRFNEFYISGLVSTLNSNKYYSGIKQIQVITIGVDDLVKTNLLVTTEPSYTDTCRYSIPLDDTLQVKSIIIRLIGLHKMDAQHSFGVQDFCVFKPYNGNPDNYTDLNNLPLVSIAGRQRIWGELKIAGTEASPADIITDSVWNGVGLLRLGNYYMWIDDDDKLRLKKNNRPTSHDDGYLV